MRTNDLSLLVAQLQQERDRVIIAIDGGTALGKSTLAKQLGTRLPATVIGTDSYVIPRHERTTSPCNPDTFRLDELTHDIRQLQDGRTLWLGEYDHCTGANGSPIRRLPNPVLIIEGAHALKLPFAFDVRIFLDAPETVMRECRRRRDQSLGNADEHWNERWAEHYELYRRLILPSAS